jgi:hypothetical protein
MREQTRAQVRDVPASFGSDLDLKLNLRRILAALFGVCLMVSAQLQQLHITDTRRLEVG